MTLSPAYLQKGETHKEWYYSAAFNSTWLIFDYRDHDGELFSCIAKDEKEVIEKLKVWKECKK